MQSKDCWQDNNSVKGTTCTCSTECQAGSSQLRKVVVSLSRKGISSQLGKVSWCFDQGSKSLLRKFQRESSSLVSCTMCLQGKQCSQLSLTSQSCPGKYRVGKRRARWYHLGSRTRWGRGFHVCHPLG